MAILTLELGFVLGVDVLFVGLEVVGCGCCLFLLDLLLVLVLPDELEGGDEEVEEKLGISDGEAYLDAVHVLDEELLEVVLELLAHGDDIGFALLDLGAHLLDHAGVEDEGEGEFEGVGTAVGCLA